MVGGVKKTAGIPEQQDGRGVRLWGSLLKNKWP